MSSDFQDLYHRINYVGHFPGSKEQFISRCNNVNVNQQDPESGKTLLHKAVDNSFVRSDLISFLLKKGADPTLRDKEGQTTLYKIVDLPFVKESEIMTLVSMVDTLFSVAALNSSVKSSRRLIREHTALSLACCNMYTLVVDKLLERGADINTVVKLAIDSRVCGSKEIDASLLHCLATSADVQDCDKAIAIAEKLLNRGLPVDVISGPDKITPLMLACKRGNKPLADYFISRGANLNACTKDKHTALGFASLGFNIDLVRLLISKGANLGPADDHDFCRMVFKFQNPTFFQEMLVSTLESPSNDKCSLATFWLLYACNAGYTKSVKIIFENGAPVIVNIRDAIGMTPFLLACNKGAIEVVQILIEKKADYKQKSNDGCGAFHFAVNANEADLIQLLAKIIPEEIDAKSSSGETPLIRAVQGYHIAAARSLIELGADCSITYLGKTPFQIAEEIQRNGPISEFLRK